MAVEPPPGARFFSAPVEGDLYMWTTSSNASFNLYLESWADHQYSGVPPSDRFQGGACTSSGHHLYLYGGIEQNTLYQLDTKVRKWKQLSAAVPMKSTGCGMITYDSKIVLFGGYGAQSGTTQPGAEFIRSGQGAFGWTNELHIFDLKKETWSSPPVSGIRPPPCVDFSFTKTDEHHAVLVEGYDSKQGRTNDVFVLDLEKMEWSKLDHRKGNPYPPVRSGHAVVCLDYGGDHPQLCLIGGRGGRADRALGDAWLLDVQSGRWREVKIPNLQPRYYHGAAAFNIAPGLTEVVVFGGCPVNNDAEVIAKTTVLRFEYIREWVLTDTANITELGSRERVNSRMTRMGEKYREKSQQIGNGDLLHVDSKLPGVILSEPVKEVTITSRGKEIDLEDEIGVSISIPRNSTIREEKIVIATSFSGAYEIPDEAEAVSPAYIIETDVEVKFSKDVEVKFQHAANLKTVDDCRDMVVLMAALQKGSSAVSKFEEMNGNYVKFSPGNRYVVLKLRSLVPSTFKVARKKSDDITTDDGKFYSARLYRTVFGIKVMAVFCMCLEHPLYTKHCDKMIAQYYPHLSDKAKGTFINALIIQSDKLMLSKSNITAWEVNMDRSMISRLEVDSPERMNIAVAELDDYPPKIVFDLFPIDEKSPPAELKVMGLKEECSFMIANERLPDVDTDDFMMTTEEFETEIYKDPAYKELDSPLVKCAIDMVGIMFDVEPLLHDPADVNVLVKKVKEIQELQKTVVELAKGAKSVEVNVFKVSNQFKKMAPALRRSSAGNPESWHEAVNNLQGISITLMKSMKELLSECTSKGVSLRSLNLIKWKETKFRLVNNVSSRWRSFGTRLDMPYNLLDAWWKECLGNSARCWNKVMGYWLDGGGTSDYPITWEGLYELLDDVEYSEITKDLKKIVTARGQ